MKINLYALRAIYLHEMDRFRRTLTQSVLSPVLTTSLYFIVFGSVIGGYVEKIDGISYGSYIVPGLLMLTLLTQSISNTSFGIFFPKFNGTIYEILAAPISTLDSNFVCDTDGIFRWEFVFIRYAAVILANCDLF